MTDWRVTQLTFGSDEGRTHSHSYYDIPVMDDAGARVICHRMEFTGRHPDPEDSVAVGIVETDRPGSWEPLGKSRAWSWQQGPMAQFVPGRNAVVWNDRDEGGFVARLTDLETGTQTVLPRPVYALDPGGHFALSLNMARLNTLRPGYGYATPETPTLEPVPEDDGVWRLPLDGSQAELILPLARAVDFLKTQLSWRARLRHWKAGYHYWFNHAKLSPDGRRFTVKLRWRKPEGGWNGRMGVSLTSAVDGTDLRLLDFATSHVIWLNDTQLYWFSENRGKLLLADDTAPRGRICGQIGAGIIKANVHLRHLPPGAAPAAGPQQGYVFDTPYREEIDLFELGPEGAARRMASFAGHTPQRGPFRCDLHPCPDMRGQRIIVTSMQDGGRQVYLLERAG